METEFNLSEKIRFNPKNLFEGEGQLKVIAEEDVKEFIRLICLKMNCKWRCDVIKELAGDKLI
jgi:hypothetical protein